MAQLCSSRDGWTEQLSGDGARRHEREARGMHTVCAVCAVCAACVYARHVSHEHRNGTATRAAVVCETLPASCTGRFVLMCVAWAFSDTQSGGCLQMPDGSGRLCPVRRTVPRRRDNMVQVEVPTTP
mmetsp:Transcript_29726/g.81659  ORF Transcript_29726/g.81659 Transcript_29726/m.81659 type:complete len:127 (-) Transcript_29726:20-400(-)|eukprot:1850872-Prymnesium_polylepis.1